MPRSSNQNREEKIDTAKSGRAGHVKRAGTKHSQGKTSAICKSGTGTFSSPISTRTRSRSASTGTPCIVKSTEVSHAVKTQRSRPMASSHQWNGKHNSVDIIDLTSTSTDSSPEQGTSKPDKKQTKSKSKGRKRKSSEVLQETTPAPGDSGADTSAKKVKGASGKAMSAMEVEESPAEDCVVCMCPIDDPMTLDKCQHTFCRVCIQQCFSKMNPLCPVCGEVYGEVTGNQPVSGQMYDQRTPQPLPGYPNCGSIVIQYVFPSGLQTHEHPHPGQPYYGTRRVAYLPDNAEGRKVLALFRRAFNARLMFTVGRSATTGLDDQVTWNDIHHKTQVHGGPTAFGYPDSTYLNRVQMELAAKGIK